MPLNNAVKIPAGSTEYVGMRVTAPAGVDLTTATVELAVVDGGVTSPTSPTWRPAGLLERPAVNVVRAYLLVGPVGGLQLAPGRWRLWMRVTDTPEVPWIPAPDPFRVV